MFVKSSAHYSLKSGIANLTIVFSVFALFVAGASVFFVYRQLNSNTPAYLPAGAREVDEEAYPDPTQQPFPTTTNKVTPKVTATPTPSSGTSVRSETGVVSGWTYSGQRDVLVSVTPKSDKLVLYLDFERDTFKDIEYIDYNLNYDTNEGEKGVTGNFDPNATTLEGYKSSGNPYIRVEIDLGTCSQGTCTYFTNPSDFELVVKTKRDGSTTIYTQTLTHKNSL